MDTRYFYFEVRILIACQSNVIEGSDRSAPPKQLLNTFKDSNPVFEWVHAYYWPGDDYYAFVRVPLTGEGIAVIDVFSDLEDVEVFKKYQPKQKTHRKIAIEEEFKCPNQLT